MMFFKNREIEVSRKLNQKSNDWKVSSQHFPRVFTIFEKIIQKKAV